MFKMQTLNCLRLEISTRNLLLSVSYCLQHTTIRHVISTDGNSGTHEIAAGRVATVTPTLPISIPIFGMFVFPFPWDSRVNANPIPTHSSSQQRGFVATADTRVT